MTVGLLSFSSQFAFNNGRSQTNLNFLQGGGEFPFLNFLKISQSWVWADGSSTRPFTPDLFDSDFYPTTLVQGGVRMGGITIPSQTEYAGKWVVSWSGNGTLSLGAGTPVTNAVSAGTSAGGTSYKLTIGAHTFVVNQEVALSAFASPWTSLNNNSYLVTAFDATSITIATGLSLGAYVSGGTVSNTLVTALAGSGSLGRCVFTPTNTTQSVAITAIGSPHVTNLKLYNINDEVALNAGGIFGTKFKQRLSQARFGVIRFLNWQNGNGGCATTWDTANRPLTYYQYQSGQTRSDFYCGTATNSGSDYTVAAPSNWAAAGSVPADKSTVHVVWGASSPQTSTVTNTGNNVNWTSHGLSTGNQVIFTDSTGTNTGISLSNNAWPLTNVYFVHTVVSANQFTISTTNGGSDVTITALNCMCRCMPTLNVGSTSAVMVLGPTCAPPSVSGGNYFTGTSQNSFTTLIYDTSIGAWINQGLISSPGLLQNGVPISLMIQLCKEVGAHPWFVSPPYACTPMTDFHTQLATLCRDTAPSWMIPRFEPPNELWNTAGGFNQTKYAQAVATSYGWGLDQDNWYGKALSTIGQAINTVYGGIVSTQTRYEVIGGFQTSTCGSPVATSTFAPRLQSTKYKLQTPQSPYTATAASGWMTHVCCSNYVTPAWYGRNQEVAKAYSWAITNNGNATAQAVDAATYEATITDGFVCTFTNGTPGTVNAVGNGLAAGQIIALITNGTFPTGLAVGNYWVVTAGDSFTISSTDPNFGGTTLVNFSGSSSGTAYCVANSSATIDCFYTYAQNIAALGAANGVNKISWYEGCYSPDYSNNEVTSVITAATQTNPCVVTLPTTIVQKIRNPNDQQNTTNPAAVVGMYLSFASVGGMTQLNGNKYQITKVGVADGLSATQVAINVDATGFSAYTSGGVATYVTDVSGTSMSTALNALRGAGKNAPNLQAHTTTLYNDLLSITGASFPSNYIMGGTANDWSILDPDIFVTPDPPQWLAVTAFNN